MANINRKDRLKNIITVYKKELEGIRSKANKILESRYTSDEGKKEELEKLKGLNRDAIDTMNRDIRYNVSAKREDMAEVNSKDFDRDYNLRLRNLLDIFSSSGGVLKDYDIVGSIKEFKDDNLAIAGLKSALISSGKEVAEVNLLLPTDYREETLKRLDGIEKMVTEGIGLDITKPDVNDLGLVFRDTSPYLDFAPMFNSLDDNLDYKTNEPQNDKFEDKANIRGHIQS